VAETPVPAWMPWASLALAVVGLGVSGYLTYEHYTEATTLTCPATSGFDCVKVTTSSYSSIVGVPVVLLGLTFFVAALGLSLPRAWRAASMRVHWARVATFAAGVGFVFYLVWAELFPIDSICLWCTVVHIDTVLLFLIACFGLALLAPEPAEEERRQGAGHR
jgi:uncharacterized membrane protein